MTTARTQNFNVGRGGAARPRIAEPKPDDFTPVSADDFEVEEVDVFDPSTLDFDPADHNVDEVKAYVDFGNASPRPQMQLVNRDRLAPPVFAAASI